jgi:hypothetical protein
MHIIVALSTYGYANSFIRCSTISYSACLYDNGITAFDWVRVPVAEKYPSKIDVRGEEVRAIIGTDVLLVEIVSNSFMASIDSTRPEQIRKF